MTLDIMRALLGLLKQRLPQLDVTFFPEQPERFHLNHPLGAVLLSFARSRFGDIQDVGRVFQPRVLHFTLTLVMRQLNGNEGGDCPARYPASGGGRLYAAGLSPPTVAD